MLFDRKAISVAKETFEMREEKAPRCFLTPVQASRTHGLSFPSENPHKTVKTACILSNIKKNPCEHDLQILKQ